MESAASPQSIVSPEKIELLKKFHLIPGVITLRRSSGVTENGWTLSSEPYVSPEDNELVVEVTKSGPRTEGVNNREKPHTSTKEVKVREILEYNQAHLTEANHATLMTFMFMKKRLMEKGSPGVPEKVLLRRSDGTVDNQWELWGNPFPSTYDRATFAIECRKHTKDRQGNDVVLTREALLDNLIEQNRYLFANIPQVNRK